MDSNQQRSNSSKQSIHDQSLHETFDQARWVNRFLRKKKQLLHPPKRFNHGCVIYNDMLYIIGGANTNKEKPIDNITIYRLNLDTSEWSIQPQVRGDKPQPLSAFCCYLYQDSAIIFGGSDLDSNQNNNLWAYMLQTNQWRRLPQAGDIPSPRESATAVIIDKVMFMYGGISLSTEDILRDMYILNLTNNRWSLLNSVGVVIPVRALQAGCAVDGKIYLFGGQHILYESNFYDDFYQITLRQKENEAVVRKIITPVKPDARCSHSMATLTNNFIVLIGGEGIANDHAEEDKEQDGSTVALSDVWMFDRNRQSWIRVQPRNPIFKARSNFSCVEDSGRLYVFGGLRNNQRLYDDLLTLELDDIEKLPPLETAKLCRECQEMVTVPKILPFSETLEMSFHHLQAMANLIKFPFAAFGLLIDNCVMTGATSIQISILEREGISGDDGQIIRQEDKPPSRNGIMQSLKSPDKTLQYILIEDNGKPWSNEQFARVILKFETVNCLEYQVADKKAKSSLIRQNIKRQFGNNLKLGCLRLGKGFVCISYFGSYVRVAMLTPKNRINHELVYVCHHYIEELPGGIFLTPNGGENKAHILSVCRTILKPNVLTEIHERHQLYIFELREMQTRQGNFYELNPYRNDYIYGNLLKIQFLERIGYNIFECPDFSLRAYISLLYLKTETKISLTTNKHNPQQILNQMFLEKIDRQKNAGFVREIDYANEYTELADCKVVELYYNPNIDRKSNLFHAGILIYHRNRLIFRYKYELGMAFPLKFYRKKYKRNQNNVFQFFGFIELPDGVPYSFLKTEMQHHILMEGFLSSLKLIMKDIKRKLSRDHIDIQQIHAIRASQVAENGRKTLTLQRVDVAPFFIRTDPKDRLDEQAEKNKQKIADDKNQQNQVMVVEQEKSSAVVKKNPPTQQFINHFIPNEPNVPVMRIQSQSQHEQAVESDNQESEQEEESNQEQGEQQEQQQEQQNEQSGNGDHSQMESECEQVAVNGQEDSQEQDEADPVEQSGQAQHNAEMPTDQQPQQPERQNHILQIEPQSNADLSSPPSQKPEIAGQQREDKQSPNKGQSPSKGQSAKSLKDIIAKRIGLQ